MSQRIDNVENKLESILASSIPIKLSASIKKSIVSAVPYISLLLALTSLLTIDRLHRWADTPTSVIYYINSIAGSNSTTGSRYTFLIWICFAILLTEIYFYLRAFSATKKRNKRGWDLLFYAMLAHFLYSILIFFTDYGSLSRLIWAMIGTIVGLYVLFQIKQYYIGRVTRQVRHTAIKDE